MTKVLESFDSRQTTGCPPVTAVWKAAILDCFDEAEAEGLIYGWAPSKYRDLVIDNGNIRIERGGHGWFAVEVPYIAPPVPEFPLGGGGGSASEAGITEFDTTGGTQHITQCESQIPYPNNADINPDAADLGTSRVIGWNRDGVDGVDVFVPKLEFTRTKFIDIEDISTEYIKNLARITGKVNSAPYSVGQSVYEAGELLFVGALGREVDRDGERQWEIAFRFSASQNRGQFDVSTGAGRTITVDSKKGHEYLWVLYKTDEVANRFVQIPDVAFVSKVYEEVDFNQYIVFP